MRKFKKNINVVKRKVKKRRRRRRRRRNYVTEKRVK